MILRKQQIVTMTTQIRYNVHFCLQFQFKEIVLTDEERRLLAKEGATIPAHMPLTKVREVVSDL